MNESELGQNSKRESLLKMDKYKDVLKEIEQNSKLLISKNNLIDETYSNIQITIRSWKAFYPSNAKNIGVKIKEENEIKGFSSIKMDKFKDSASSAETSDISSKNIANMRVCFFQTFLYMFNLTIIIPTNFLFIEKLGYNPILSGVILSIAPLGALIYNFVFSTFFQESYRTPLLLATLSLIIGNLIYAISENVESIVPIILGRIIVGFGCTRQLNRQYIISYIPRNYTSKYFFQYLLYSSIGLALGNYIKIIQILNSI